MPDDSPSLETRYDTEALELLRYLSPFDTERVDSEHTQTKLKLLSASLRLAYHHGHGDGLKEAAAIIKA